MTATTPFAPLNEALDFLELNPDIEMFELFIIDNNGVQLAVYIDGMKQEAELTTIGELIVGPEAANRYGKNNGVYNLQGQRVGNTTEGLPSGIYIVNGRKHVVR